MEEESEGRPTKETKVRGEGGGGTGNGGDGGRQQRGRLQRGIQQQQMTAMHTCAHLDPGPPENGTSTRSPYRTQIRMEMAVRNRWADASRKQG